MHFVVVERIRVDGKLPSIRAMERNRMFPTIGSL